MTEWIPFIISAALALVGIFAFITAAVGVFRFDHVLYRLHAAAIADTVGVACIALSAIVYLGVGFVSLKELAVLFIMTLTSPVSTHLLTEIEYVMGKCRQKTRPLGGDDK